jgi:hypothetical protein
MQRSESQQAPASSARRRMTALARAAAGLVLGASLAACSSSFASRSASPASGPDTGPSASTVPGSSPGSSGGHPGSHSSPRVNTDGNRISGLISFTGTFHVTGSRTAHLSFRAFPGVTKPASSCSALAADGTPVGTGEPRQFRIPAPPGGSTAYFDISVGPYHGPGSYGTGKILSVGQSIVVGTASYGLLSSRATASATIRPNGSGTFRFAGAKGGRRGRTISGTVTWKCTG